MSIPDFQTIMLPLLQFAGDQREHTPREAIEHLADSFRLSDKERNQLLPSGQQASFDNRVHWAIFHLRHAMLLESTRRGFFHISLRGIQVLQNPPQRIDLHYLMQFSEFVEFRKGKHKDNGAALEQLEVESQQTPEEMMGFGYQRIRENLAQELLSRVKQSSPSFFERLVVELLVSMGYGGSRQDAGAAVGKSGDGGIDGIINEDRLGLDVIYIQAKRWENPVGRPEIQTFVGALQGQRARKGIFITTSSFTTQAQQYASNIDPKVILIDGERLTQLMIDHNVGVSRIEIYEIKRIDSDYFDEV